MNDTGINVRNTVREFILDTFVFEPENKKCLTDSVGLIDEGILDSFGVHEMLFFLESEFAITIEDEEVLSGNFGSIGAITAFVQRKMQGG